MTRTRLLVIAAFAALATPVFAVETKSWTHSDQPDFERGTLKKLSLRSNGRLTLAPAFRELFDASTAYLWALAEDSKGVLYTAGGGPSATSSKVFAVTPDGKSRVAAEIPGLQIQALAIDSKDRVYAATAPDSKIYRLGAGGKADVFYEPKAKYVWAMVFDRKGNLFVATGDGGDVHRVTPDGKGSVFFSTGETHARSMVVDAQDNLIVGTEPGGLVLRISPAGEGFVLYQAAKREVTALALARDGAIYAAAVGTRAGAAAAPMSITIPPQVQINAPPGAVLRPAVPPAASPQPPAISGGSEVYRIGSDGYPQRVWSHSQDVVYAIGFDAAGKPILGTGNKGNIYRLDTELVSTLLINAAPTQVTAFVSGRRGLFAATGNVGKLYQIGPGFETSGTYESEALDANGFTYWGRVRLLSEGNNGKVLVETRSGNLDRPQKNWSPWQQLGTESRVASPSARFLQYRVTLQSGLGDRSPEVQSITLAYLPKNAPPQIDEVDLSPANYRFPAPSTIVPVSGASPASITLPPLGQRRTPASTLTLDSSSSQSMTYAKGHVGVRWSVSDPNSDAMVYRVEVRGAKESVWKLLRDKLREKYYSWDSTAFPDGDYVVRITASDSPDNAPAQALDVSAESDSFTIDNTPPRITGLAGSRVGGKLTVRWHAADLSNVIGKAEYSLNGGEWTFVDPVSKLSDSKDLDYSLQLDGGSNEQIIAVRVTDEYDNQTVEKVVVR